MSRPNRRPVRFFPRRAPRLCVRRAVVRQIGRAAREATATRSISGERLIHDEPRLVTDGHDELDLLRHSLRQLDGPLALAAGELDPLEPAVDPPSGAVGFDPPDRGEEEQDLAAVGSQDVHDHAQGGRLPRSIRAEQPEHASARDLEGEIADRIGVTKRLRDAPECEGWHRGILRPSSATDPSRDGRAGAGESS